MLRLSTLLSCPLNKAQTENGNGNGLQELAEKLAEPLQQRISTKFFTGAMAHQIASEAADEGAADARAAAPGTAHTELAQQLAEARQAAAASVQVCLPGHAFHASKPFQTLQCPDLIETASSCDAGMCDFASMQSQGARDVQSCVAYLAWVWLHTAEGNASDANRHCGRHCISD